MTATVIDTSQTRRRQAISTIRIVIIAAARHDLVARAPQDEVGTKVEPAEEVIA